jgi:hypothetical protein
VIARFFGGKKPDDLLLLFFSGHGVRDERGLLYLAVQDTEHDLLNATAIPAAFITDEMDRSRSRRQVLILDCCHSGAFSHGAKAAADVGVGTAAAFAGTGFGRMVLTATDATQFAWEGDQVIGPADKSVFTHFLVEGLRTGQADTDADGQITLDELYDYVYERVVKATSKQTPRKFTYNQQGDVVIARNSRPVVKPAELPPELRQAIESPLSGVREGAVRELERLLRGRHRGLRLAALETLRELARDDSRRVSQAAEAALAAEMEGLGPDKASDTEPAPRVVAEPEPDSRQAAPLPVEQPETAQSLEVHASQPTTAHAPELRNLDGAAVAPSATEAVSRLQPHQISDVSIAQNPVGAVSPAPTPVASEASARQPSGSARPADPPGTARWLASNRLNTVWLVFLLAVALKVLGSAAYGVITDAGQPLWVADFFDSSLSGLGVGLALWMRGRLNGRELLALVVMWTTAGVAGGANIDRLRDSLSPVVAWISGLALIGVVRGAATALLLARRHQGIGNAPHLVTIMAGWTVALALPPLLISGTAYWASPTTGSGLVWGLLEGVVGAGMMLWQVEQFNVTGAREAGAEAHGFLRSTDWGYLLFAAVGWPVAFGLLGTFGRYGLDRSALEFSFIAGLLAGALAALIISLPLRQGMAAGWGRMTALMVARAVAWGLGAWLMVRSLLEWGQTPVGLWGGFALVVVLSSVMTAVVFGRHLGIGVLSPPVLLVAAAWLLAALLPYRLAWDLLASLTPPPTWLLLAAALSGAAGAGVTLWQVHSSQRLPGMAPAA